MNEILKRLFITLLVCSGTYALAFWTSVWLPEATKLLYYFAGMAYMWYLKETEV